jgi:hypothetical protein
MTTNIPIDFINAVTLTIFYTGLDSVCSNSLKALDSGSAENTVWNDEAKWWLSCLYPTAKLFGLFLR